MRSFTVEVTGCENCPFYVFEDDEYCVYSDGNHSEAVVLVQDNFHELTDSCPKVQS